MNSLCPDSIASLSENTLQARRSEGQFGTHTGVVVTSVRAGSARRTECVLGISIALPDRGFTASQLLLVSIAVHPCICGPCGPQMQGWASSDRLFWRSQCLLEVHLDQIDASTSITHLGHRNLAFGGTDAAAPARP